MKKIIRPICFVLLGFYLAVTSFFTFVHFTGKDPLPFTDRGSWIISCKSEKAKQTAIGIFQTYGIEPRFRLDTHGTERCIFWDNSIVNFPAKNVDSILGYPTALKAFVVKDPEVEAGKIAATLKSQGFTATILPQELGYPENSLYFIKTNLVSDDEKFMFIVRKWSPDLGPMPPKWTDTE